MSGSVSGIEFPDDLGTRERTLRKKTPGGPKGGASPQALFDGQYELTGCLETGGMGRVFVAVDVNETEQWRNVAIKVLRPKANDSGVESWEGSQKRRMRREADIARAVRHDHVINVRRYGELKAAFSWTSESSGKSYDFPVSMPFIVMDYIADAVNLKEYLKARGGRLSEAELKELLFPIAQALDHAHGEDGGRCGIVHRDVKPSNILVQDRSGTPYAWLFDFGISKSVAAKGVPYDVTFSDGYKTAAYAAPERLAEEVVSPSPAEDVFSFAVVLYECLMGRHPFCEDARRTSTVRLYKRIDRGVYEKIPSRTALAQAIMRGLSPQPDQRPPTCGEFFGAGSSFGGFAFSLSCAECEWNGREQCPKVLVRGDETLREGTDYHVTYDNNRTVGVAMASVVGLSLRYRGKVVQLPFQIVARKISHAVLDKIPPCTYTGTPITPPLRLTDVEVRADPLARGTDYEVSYRENKDVGEGVVCIQGVGGYEGEMTKSFEILPKDIARTSISRIPELAYEGRPPRPDICVVDKDANHELVRGVDYDVDYGSSLFGKSWLRIHGKGSYAGVVKKNFFIARRELSKVFVGTVPDQTYSAIPILDFEIEVFDSVLKRQLKNGVDYRLRFENVKAPGTATARLTGMGAYVGEVIRTFTIHPGQLGVKNWKDENLFVYDGTNHRPDIPLAGLPADVEVSFAFSAEGPFLPEVDLVHVASPRPVWVRFSLGGYDSLVKETIVVIRPRDIAQTQVEVASSFRYDEFRDKIGCLRVVDTELNRELAPGDSYRLGSCIVPGPGDIQVTVLGRGDYCGMKKVPVTILPGRLPPPVVQSYEGEFDNEPHTINVITAARPSGCSVSYARSKSGPFALNDAPAFRDACPPTPVWFRIDCPGYEPFIGSGTVEIRPRRLPPPVVQSYEGEFDNESHTINVVTAALPSGCSVSYARSKSGPFALDDAPAFRDVCPPTPVWFRIDCPGYEPFIGSGTVEIRPSIIHTTRCSWVENARKTWANIFRGSAAKVSARVDGGREKGICSTYRVIDLASGQVTGLDAVPTGGWTDEYKTSKIVLRRIEPGTFTMGSPTGEEGRDNDETPHRVTLTKPYYVGVFEVTQGQWERVMGANPSRFKSPTRPVENVSYQDIRGKSKGAEWPKSRAVDAGSFLGRLRAKTGDAGFDLPTEAEWEYACRAGTTTALPNGKNLTIVGENNGPQLHDIAWYGGNSGVDFELSNGHDSSGWPQKQHDHSRAGTHPVGKKNPNAWGLYDMIGNVWEWCGDWYGEYRGDDTDPQGPTASGESRFSRGGGWRSLARYCRSASRGGCRPSDGGSHLGFRLCCSAGPSE